LTAELPPKPQRHFDVARHGSSSMQCAILKPALRALAFTPACRHAALLQLVSVLCALMCSVVCFHISCCNVRLPPEAHAHSCSRLLTGPLYKVRAQLLCLSTPVLLAATRHNTVCNMPFKLRSAPVLHFMHVICCMYVCASSPGIVGPFGISFCCSGSSAGLNSGVLGVYSG
jgi:hypothetical protein